MNIQYLTPLWAELTRFPKVTLSFRPSLDSINFVIQISTCSRPDLLLAVTAARDWLPVTSPAHVTIPFGFSVTSVRWRWWYYMWKLSYTFWLFQQWDIVLHNTKRARKKLNDPLNFDVLFLFNWPARRVREFKAHFIGRVWQQSRVLGTRLAELLGGSQVSQHFGRDKLGVDKSGLPQSKHFATL